MTHFARSLVGALSLLTLLGGCKSSAQRAKEEADALPVVNGFKDRLHSIHTSLPSVETLAEARCDDGEIAKAIGKSSGSVIAHIDTKFLEELEGGPRRAFAFHNKFHDPYDWLVSTRMQLFSFETTPGEEHFTAAADEVRGNIEYGGNLLVVIQVVKNVEPKFTKQPSVSDSFFDTTYFESGDFEAWALVFTLDGPKRACQALVQAKSGDHVDVKSGQFNQALDDDYVAQIQKQIDLSLKRISPRLNATF